MPFFPWLMLFGRLHALDRVDDFAEPRMMRLNMLSHFGRQVFQAQSVLKMRISPEAALVCCPFFEAVGGRWLQELRNLEHRAPRGHLIARYATPCATPYDARRSRVAAPLAADCSRAVGNEDTAGAHGLALLVLDDRQRRRPVRVA